MRRIFFTCLLFTIAKLISTINYKPHEGVLELNYRNFNTSLLQNRFLLVEFYASWCVNCQNVRPEYTRAAWQLLKEDSNIRLAGVDIEKEEKLSLRYDIKEIPTFKLFVEGKEVKLKYDGGHTSTEIVTWLKRIHNEL